MEMATAMANCDGDGNGRQQGQWQRWWLTATQQRWRLWWAMATVTATADGNGDGNRLRQRGQQWRQRCQRQRRWQRPLGDGHGDGNNDKKRDASSCAGNVQHCGRATPCLHPHEQKRKCIHQRCIMGATLLRVFAPFHGGGLLTAHHGLFFCLFFTTTVQFTEQPSICPPHYSGAQEPCQLIDALPPPLLQEPRQPIDNLPRLLLHFFVKVSPGRAWFDYNLTFLFWCEMSNFSSTFFISQAFPLSLTEHTKFIWKHPFVIVETFKVKVYLTVSRHYPAQPFCLVLVLAFAWQLFTSSHLRLAPFLGTSIVLQLHNWSSKFWKSTVLDSAKPLGRICFFCYYLALSIFSPRVRLK